MEEFVTRMYNIDQNVFILIGMMCVWAALILNKALDHAIITVVALPTFLNFALATIVVLDDLQIVLANERSINLIMFAGIGIIVALCLMVIVFVVTTSYIDLRDQLEKDRDSKIRKAEVPPAWIGRA
ncbi:MAG: hypothetical protein RLZ98_3726 [Pseudomonadota bacterium]|jgi:hypothetical protein